MKLSERLKLVTEMVTPGYFALDVGCDHGYTAISLVKNGICPAAAASDVREGPLRAARENIRREGLSERIRVFLADGVPKNAESYVPENMPAALVITGMGGQLILRILRSAGPELCRFSELVLGPQSEIPMVRRELLALGFGILDERMTEEDGKFYNLLRAGRIAPEKSGTGSDSRCGSGTGSNRSGEGPEERDEGQPAAEDPDLLFGKHLLERRDPVLGRWLSWRLGILQKIEASLLAGGTGEGERLWEVRREAALIKEALTLYEGDKAAERRGCGAPD